MTSQAKSCTTFKAEIKKESREKGIEGERDEQKRENEVEGRKKRKKKKKGLKGKKEKNGQKEKKEKKMHRPRLNCIVEMTYHITLKYLEPYEILSVFSISKSMQLLLSSKSNHSHIAKIITKNKRCKNE